MFRTHLIQLEASDLQLLADEEKSIQGAIETGLEYRLKPAQPAILNLSSRYLLDFW